MAKLPPLLPGRSRAVAVKNALRLRASGLSRRASVKRAVGPLLHRPALRASPPSSTTSSPKPTVAGIQARRPSSRRNSKTGSN